MEIQLNVPSLEDLAFQMSYKEILSNLILCYEHRPEGKRVPWLPFSSVVTTSEILSSENIRRLVRNRLNQHLVGTMGDKVREKYVKKFYDSYSNGAEESQLVEAWVFLDCVLEEDIIKELKIQATFPESLPNPKLITTIIKWSPRLTKLTLDFKLMKAMKINLISEEVEDLEELEKLQLVIRSLDSLQHLTHLVLFGLGDTVKFIVLSLIGKSCPKLYHLTVERRDVWEKHLLALIFGESLSELADFNCEIGSDSWWGDEALENLMVPIEFLTPICSSLRELRLLGGYDAEKSPHIFGHSLYVSKEAVAFAVRHFPKLQRIYGMRTSQAVTTLHQSAEWSSRDRFRMACQGAAERGNFNSSHLPERFLSRNLSCTYNGHLSLTRIDAVNVYYKEMLDAVGALCPLLKEVVFCSVNLEYSVEDGRSLEPITFDSTVSPEDLESILKGWPKLTTIECKEVPSGHMKAILNVFGPELHNLRLKKCRRIKLENLAKCSKLKSLKIVRGSLFRNSEEIDASLDVNTFLPKLKIFESNICLGRQSHLFEEKSAALVKLDLSCSHVGIVQAIEDGPPCPKRFKGLGQEATKRLELLRIGELWTPLEFLAIRQFAVLSLDMVAELISHLPKLKEVILPQRISSCDVLLFHSMKAQLSSRIPSAIISFEDFGSHQKCLIMD